MEAPNGREAITFGRRTFLELWAGAALSLSSATAGALISVPADESDWRATRLCRACLAGPVKEEIEAMAAAGANVIQCNLNGAVTELRPGPGILGGDPVGDFVQLVHDLGAKATGYLNTRLAPQLKDHPDWIIRTHDGKALGGDASPSACQNSPYGQFLIDQMAGYTRKTAIDGWWLDCWTFGLQTCWCPFCKDGFTKDTQLPMPGKPDLDDTTFQKYLEWRDKKAEGFFKRMHDTVHGVRPDVHIWVNFNMGPQNAPLPHNDSVFRMVESPTVEAWLAPYRDNALFTPFGIARMVGAAGGRESEIWMVPTALQWDRTTTPDIEVMARIYTILTYGAVVQFPAAPGHMSQMKMAFDAIKARQEWLIGTEPLPWAAIVLSYRSAEFYGKGKAIETYYHEVMGVFRACTEEHFPVQIVTENDVEAGNISKYAVVIVPNGACLSEKAMESLRKFVSDGGGLIATHETSLYNDYGVKRDDFALAELFGAHYRGEEAFRGWKSDRLWLDKHETTDDDAIEYARWDCTVSTAREWLGSVDWAGRALNVEAIEGLEMPAKRNGEGKNAPTWPGVVVSTHNKGKVAFFPLEIGTSYYHTSYPYLRRWLYQTIRWAAGGGPPVEVKGPLCLIATFWQQTKDNRIVVHLLNDNSSAGRRAMDADYLPIREEVLPLLDVEIRADTSYGAMRLQPDGTELLVSKDGNFSMTKIPKILHHSIVVCERTA